MKHRWFAARDGIAHADPPKGPTMCRRSRIDERWAWPATRRCGACLMAAGLQDAALLRKEPIR
jgi:hypothetical protein